MKKKISLIILGLVICLTIYISDTYATLDISKLEENVNSVKNVEVSLSNISTEGTIDLANHNNSNEGMGDQVEKTSQPVIYYIVGAILIILVIIYITNIIR